MPVLCQSHPPIYFLDVSSLTKKSCTTTKTERLVIQHIIAVTTLAHRSNQKTKSLGSHARDSIVKHHNQTFTWSHLTWRKHTHSWTAHHSKWAIQDSTGECRQRTTGRPLSHNHCISDKILLRTIRLITANHHKTDELRWIYMVSVGYLRWLWSTIHCKNWPRRSHEDTQELEEHRSSYVVPTGDSIRIKGSY